MYATRRDMLIKAGRVALFGLLSANGLLKSIWAYADWNKSAFSTKDVPSTIKALGGDVAVESADIQITAAEIAENGQVVPVTIVSNIPETESISILIEHNPNTLAATFEISPGTEPRIRTRIKMAQTSNVYGLVKSGGRFYMAAKEIKVTLGGC